ncbi:MAG: autotransporter-associated beta strand repeat-containing protein, partial [Verrucomicrobia bacterium]|nr:autotransporter-associated beta strand repeat-containing protein [Verrucomicrobiota bacterium]
MATNFFWTNIVTDSWSIPGNWTNELVDGLGPVTGGSNNYVLTFAPAGVFSSTNDLAGSFLLNQLIFGGSTVSLWGSQLQFTNNESGGGPQVLQNSGAAVVINNDLLLDNNLLLGGSGSGLVTLNGVLGGVGGLTLDGNYKLVMTNVNTYAGPTIISNGRLVLQNGGAVSGSSAVVISDVTTATLLLDGGITVTGVTLTNFMTQGVVGGLIGTNGINTWAGPIWLGSQNARFAAANSSTLALSGVISSTDPTYGLTIRSDNASSGVVLISGTANTYSNTTVTVGNLQIGANNALPVAGVLSLGNGISTGAAMFDLAGYNQRLEGLTDAGPNMQRVVTNTSGTLSTLTISNMANYTFAGVIRGNLAVVKTGVGTETLSGTNTYAGGTIINGGILKIGNTNALGVGTNGYFVQVNSGGAFDLGGMNLNYAGNSLTVMISGMGIGPTTGAVLNSGASLANQGLKNVVLGADAAIGQNGGNRFDIYGTFDGGNHTLYKVGNNEVSMQTAAANLNGVVVNAGNFVLQNANALGNGFLTVNTGAVAYTWNVAGFTNAMTLVGGTFRSDQQAVTLTGPIVLAGATNMFDARSSLTVNGQISGPGGLTIIGTNIVTFTNANTYAGRTILAQATNVLLITHGSALGSTAGDTIVSNNTSLRISGDITVNESLTLYGDGFPINQGALNNVGGTNTWAGGITGGSIASTLGTLILSGGVTNNGLLRGRGGIIIITNTPMT